MYVYNKLGLYLTRALKYLCVVDEIDIKVK